MRSLPTADENPFNPSPPDGKAELDALVRSLRRAQGFSLLLACCNQAEQRERLMDNIVVNDPDLQIQRLAIYQPTEHLLDLIRTQLRHPKPDAVFVYGLEAWLPAGKAAEESPFVLNLNAARNLFPSELPCPLVLWLPEHLLAAIAHGAPDFCSVRSGLFIFAATAEARSMMLGNVTSIGLQSVLGMPAAERGQRLTELQDLLAEYETQPPPMRDLLAEARILDRIGTFYEVSGDYPVAEQEFRRALALREQILGDHDAIVAESLNNLALLLGEQGRYQEAEPLLQRAIEIHEKVNGPEAPRLVANLGNLASILSSQGRYKEAEALLRRALNIATSTSDPNDVNLALLLGNLSVAVSSHNPAEAEVLARRALQITEEALGPSHPSVAVALQNLADSLREQGRDAEAQPLLQQALRIADASLPPDHPDLAMSLNNYGVFLQDAERLDEAEPLLARALAINERILGTQHPRTLSARHNLEMLRHARLVAVE